MDRGFEQLYANTVRAVLGYLRRRTKHDDAVDVAAEVYLVAWRRDEVQRVRAALAGLPVDDQELDDGRVRVELPEIWQRGPEPDGLVEELRAHDIDVERRQGATVVPWALGGITGTGFEFGGWAGDSPGLTSDDREEFERAAEVAGLEFLDHGGYLIDPEVFEGEIQLTVGVPPWEQPEPSRPPSTVSEN